MVGAVSEPGRAVASDTPQPLNAELYTAMYRIRIFEQRVLDEFPRGRFYGTTHTYLGQEANAVGVLKNAGPDDVVVSNHRCHGHFLAYGGDPRALFAELMGKATGVCGGLGGSQHLHWRNFYSNGILGGTMPIAVGMALAERWQAGGSKESGPVTIAFLGDGTLGEGVLYEALNMASLWSAPVLFVLENNRIAQTTPVELAVAGGLAARFAAFGLAVEELDTSDVVAIHAAARRILDDMRASPQPRALILHTHRFGPHSKGDDTRDPAELAAVREERDPLKVHRDRLEAGERASIEAAVEDELAEAYNQALADPAPEKPGSR